MKFIVTQFRMYLYYRCTCTCTLYLPILLVVHPVHKLHVDVHVQCTVVSVWKRADCIHTQGTISTSYLILRILKCPMVSLCSPSSTQDTVVSVLKSGQSYYHMLPKLRLYPCPGKQFQRVINLQQCLLQSIWYTRYSDFSKAEPGINCMPVCFLSWIFAVQCLRTCM